MRKDMLQQATNMNQKRKRRKGWQSFVRTLALCVVFCTTYVLILPAITMQEETVCGYEAHAHSPECYSQPQAAFLGCGIPADAIVVHQHSELCRNEAGELICPLEEKAVHVHDDSCYTLTEVTTCPTHVHSEACTRTESTLVCEIPESEGHAHSESCTGTASVLICTAEVHEHGEGCYEEQALVCDIPESEEHTHSESCTGTASVLVCTAEIHQHGEGCYEEQTLVCDIPEAEAHTHGESCFAVTEIPCTEPVAEEGHVHDDTCLQQTRELTCTLPELQLHSHTEECFDAEGTLICEKPVVVEHIHTEACLALPENTEPVLTCGLEEHTHDTACYPLEEEPVLGLEYFCGYAVHTHIETCYDEEGTLTCTIPEHSHEAACVVEDLDLTADMELPAVWEATIAELEFTGIWADDLLTVAESQLGYRESTRNCVLKNDRLLGYTRYADWYGEYYGDWDDMFVSFCLHYAEIPEEAVPHSSDTARWIEALKQKELYTPAGDYTPVAGDLIFWDSDDDGNADKSGIVFLATTQKIQVIAGDTDKNRVELLTFEEKDADQIIGFCILPVNPMDQEQWQAAEAVNALLAALPEADTVTEALLKLNEEGDKAGYDALHQEVASLIEAAETAYNALNEVQQARVTGLERLAALKEACGEESWQQFAALTDDGAVLTQLSVGEVQVVTAPAEEASEEEAAENEEQETPATPENTVRNGDTVRYLFTAAAESYDADVSYGEAVVKFELVMPLLRYKATFDLEAMPWLEDSHLTMEWRTINGTDTSCQVLTGYRKLTASETNGIAVPGSFTEAVVVKVLDMGHGEQLSLSISAAMEHNTWEGVCEEHQAEERLTVQAEALTAYDPLDPDDQLANFNAFRTSIGALIAENFSLEQAAEAADQVQNDLDAAYVAGMLSYDQYYELSMLVLMDLRADLSMVAEAPIGNFWKTEVPTPKTDFTPKTEPNVPVIERTQNASTYRLLRSRSVPTTSSGQIVDQGGSNSADNAVYVSKTIAGTNQENVFDITLEIVTQDRIETVYNEPDMAVVIVMDISNTMNDRIGSTTTSRYEAAMDAAEDFIDRFQQEAGKVSQLGYVAFNTSGHLIFDLQTCDTPEKAAALSSEMRADTRAIIRASGYASSNSRFTNMEAGLKMAWHMLDDANNRNKFIVFLSDGFPTTYLKNHSDTSTNYAGYTPSSSSGTVGNDGVFYDNIRNKWCSAGTNYSDTGAVYARRLATKIKADGIDIFSIGVDVAGQTIKKHFDNTANTSYSFVDYKGNSYPSNYKFEIGTWNSTASFKNWLKGGASTGIGSGEGYYYDSNDTGGLAGAYDAIFDKIKIINGASSHLDWVVSDPMPGMGVHEKEDIEFIAFWDLSESALHDSLTGTLVDAEHGLYNENTASFNTTDQTITWDLKKSIYGAVAGEDGNQYMFRLKYRVRLRNEMGDFVENTDPNSQTGIYSTNDVTSMGYRLIEVSGNSTVIGERKYIQFPIPSVKGYLSELSFVKLQPDGAPLDGAEFTLSHDTENCGYCRGDGAGHVSVPNQVATSGTDGQVTFTNIPSGHTYTLTETKVPEGFAANGNTYQVVVAYDTLTVTVTDADGKELSWTESITNGKYYVLPNTGGSGTSFLTFGGLLMMAAACVYFVNKFGRKRQRGGATRR